MTTLFASPKALTWVKSEIELASNLLEIMKW